MPDEYICQCGKGKAWDEDFCPSCLQMRFELRCELIDLIRVNRNPGKEFNKLNPEVVVYPDMLADAIMKFYEKYKEDGDENN